MGNIKIKNFGPIKVGNRENEGWIDIAKVTVFIGNQGSGKSTIAKLISTFTWIEKALVRGDFAQKELERKNKLKNKFLSYHRIEEYLSNETLIEYKGDAYYIRYESGFMHVKENEHQRYPLPQIMYVPAERNFLSYLKKAGEMKLSSPALQEFLVEFDNAKNTIKSPFQLPVNNAQLEYHKLTNTLYIKGSNYRIQLGDASSGFQSFVPLTLVSNYLANRVGGSTDSIESMSGDEIVRFRKSIREIVANKSLTEEQRRIAISELSGKFNKTAFINIVEEPEQNLFPNSQRSVLYSLLSANTTSPGNKLIVTTHSPYIINYLSLSIQAGYLAGKLNSKESINHFETKIEEIVPKTAMLNEKDLLVYELNEIEGTIIKLAKYQGIPSDNNYLNESLRAGNELFDKLLEIEEEL